MTEKQKSEDVEHVREEERPPPYVLRLYVAGHTPRSTRAIENLKRIVAKHLDDNANLEIVDIYQQGQLAREANVIGAPTLIKELPLPFRRLVGDLSDEDKVLLGLNLVEDGE